MLGKPTKRTFYDPKLKLWFEVDDEVVVPGYEVEIEDVFVEFSNNKKKLEDFYRRINYRYDWAQIDRHTNGTVKSIKNSGELKTNWQEIRMLVKNAELQIRCGDKSVKNEWHFQLKRIRENKN